MSVAPGAPLDVFGTMRVANSAGQFAYVGFPAGPAQTAILGQFLTSDTNYPQLRFSRLMGGSLVDIGQDGNGNFGVFGNTVERLTVNTNGNVGIGTTTPTSTLQVNGTVAASALRAPGAGVNTGTFAFIQRAVGTNTIGDQTFIYNPVCDGDPNAILIVTHNWTADTNSTSQYNTKPVGVYYTGANWAIFNEDTSAMALGRAFNVMVIKN